MSTVTSCGATRWMRRLSSRIAALSPISPVGSIAGAARMTRAAAGAAVTGAA